MTSDKVREFHTLRPFQPFTLYLGDGRELTVRHPEMLAMSPSGRAAAVYGPKDRLDVIDLLLVSGIGVGNGHAWRQEPRWRAPRPTGDA